MEYQQADRDYIRLSIAFEGRAKQANELLRNFDSISELFEAVKNVDSDILTMIKREQAEKLRLTASDVYIDDFISNLEKNGVSALTPNSEAYPTELKYIADPPFVLYARGKCARLQAETPFAIIGARRCSDYGKKVSAHMGCELAKNGVTIVSGLAYGCDSLAAQGALSAAEQKYPTAAILGQGVCTSKTDGTAEIMEAIIENGCVMSEFLPFTRAATYFFPMRNRIISGMSCGVLVVEAGEKSGTMITANCALEQGRTVYAVPGRITDRMSFGTNELIRKGMAEPVFSAEDLLFHLGIDPECSKKSELRGRGSSELKLTGNQKILFDLIELGEKNFDEICELTQLPVEVLNLHLTELEFSGLIKQLPGRIYTLS